MKSNNKIYSMFNQIKIYVLSNKTNICNVHFVHSVKESLRFPYFNQSLKFLRRFTAINILRYHIVGPRNLADWKLHEDLYFPSLIKAHHLRNSPRDSAIAEVFSEGNLYFL